MEMIMRGDCPRLSVAGIVRDGILSLRTHIATRQISTTRKTSITSIYLPLYSIMVVYLFFIFLISVL